MNYSDESIIAQELPGGNLVFGRFIVRARAAAAFRCHGAVSALTAAGKDSSFRLKKRQEAELSGEIESYSENGAFFVAASDFDLPADGGDELL